MAGDERWWAVEPGEDGEIDMDDLTGSLMEIAALLRRNGGAVTIAAHREPLDAEVVAELRLPPDTHLTESATIRWTPHMPLPRNRRKTPRQEPAESEPADRIVQEPEVLEPEAA